MSHQEKIRMYPAYETLVLQQALHSERYKPASEQKRAHQLRTDDLNWMLMLSTHLRLTRKNRIILMILVMPMTLFHQTEAADQKKEFASEDDARIPKVKL